MKANLPGEQSSDICTEENGEPGVGNCIVFPYKRQINYRL